jgi:hypothetical protein
VSSVNIHAASLIVINGRQRNVINAKLWGKLKDSNYDGNLRHVTSGRVGGAKFQLHFVVVAQSAQYLLKNTNN